MALSLFCDIDFVISDFYPQEDPSGESSGLKTNYMENINNFKIKRPFYILKCRWLGLTETCNFLSEVSHPGVIPSALKPFFIIIYVKFHDF